MTLPDIGECTPTTDDGALFWLARGEHSLPAHDRWLSDAERNYADALRFAKRRTEFLVARWTMKNAVALWSGRRTDPQSLAGVEARRAPTGAPVLHIDGSASDAALSLSDRAGWAVCLLGPPETSVGIDVELVEPRTDTFVADWFTGAEREVVAHGDRDLAANLIWSAKESALKVMQTGLRRDTRSVEVSFDAAADSTEAWRRLSVRSRERTTYLGWWRRYGDFVVTLCADKAPRPPRSLEHPPALGAAVPVHSWLRAPTAVGPH